jgi:hypothetical protein
MNHLTRRDVLQTLSALGVSVLLPGLDVQAARKRGAERPKSLITLWMAGGPSQLETWDPHPGTKIGGPGKAMKTRNRALEISDLYPRTAEEIHHLSVIRSLVSKEGDHERGTYFVKTGYRPIPKVVHPSLGAILTHERPAQGVEIPQHVSLGNSPWPARGGFLGARFDAFKIFEPGRNVRNMQTHVPSKRQKRRLANLEVVSRAFRKGREQRVEETQHQRTIERALAMMTSEQLKAFHLDDVPRALREAYGDTSFGRGCLVARRLVEEGVRAVEVSLTGWDTHVNNYEGHVKQSTILDPAFAALIRDLRERELWNSTILLCIGEFGRKPKINAFDGRDHWPTGFSCVIGGGGLRGGLVVGATDPTGESEDPQDPMRVQDLYATILTAFDLDPAKQNITPIGRPIALADGRAIPRLLEM